LARAAAASQSRCSWASRAARSAVVSAMVGVEAGNRRRADESGHGDTNRPWRRGRIGHGGARRGDEIGGRRRWIGRRRDQNARRRGGARGEPWPSDRGKARCRGACATSEHGA
jgi:hypothetical protein